MASPERHPKLHRRYSPNLVVGSPPGTLAQTAVGTQSVVQLTAYGPDELIEREVEDIGEVGECVGQWPVTWVNVAGLGDLDVLAQLAEVFGLHRLALEDVTSVRQRPKVEEYEGGLFIVARMLSMGEWLKNEQFSMFLGEGFVLTFQETRGDCFDAMRERLRADKGRVRGAGADYLAYALLDALVDSYFPLVEAIGDRLDELEDAILEKADMAAASGLHSRKRMLRQFRRAAWPLREAINILLHDECPLITKETRVYMRDCYDHCVQALDLVEMYRELASDLMNLHLTVVSNRMNEIMKVLTIIATIFIPLSFIAGVYGMNFVGMPELKWRWGYPLCLAVMATAASGMLLYFRRKGWLGGQSVKAADAQGSLDAEEQ